MKTKLNDDALAELKFYESSCVGAAYEAIELFRLAIILAEKQTHCLHSLSDIADLYDTFPDRYKEQLNSGHKLRGPSHYDMAQDLLASAIRMQKNWNKSKRKGDRHGNTKTD